MNSLSVGVFCFQSGLVFGPGSLSLDRRQSVVPVRFEGRKDYLVPVESRSLHVMRAASIGMCVSGSVSI